MFQIGATLRETRVRRSLSLKQAEDDTKIRIKYLQAMENEEFDALPAPAYAKGFLRTYATYLELDPELILDEYNSRFMPQSDQHPFAGSSALQPRHTGRRRSGLLFVAVVAVLILLLIYLLGLRGGQHSSGTRPTINPSVIVPLSPSPSPSPSDVSPTPSSSPKAQRTVLLLSAKSPTWVEVRLDDAAGTPLFVGTLTPGQDLRQTRKGTMHVRIGGDPANVTMKVNGRAVQTAGAPSGAVFVIVKGKVKRL